MKPFGIISDTHHHLWSSFSEILPTGVNSRLQYTLNETLRAAAEVLAAGGNKLVHGGDLFHVRGSISPSVLNPTKDCYKQIIDSGVAVIINAGNHDLEDKSAKRISSAITALEDIGCVIVNEPSTIDELLIIPWIQNIGDLKVAIEATPVANRANLDLILHAPIDGVIAGLPDHGISDEYLAKLGYRRVFAGHYHHHKDFGSGIYSIGALTHQTWGDVGTKAGFLIVRDGSVNWHSTRAPSFIEIDGSTDPDEIPLIVDGNFVRVHINSAKPSDIETMRQFMVESGAKGVNVLQATSSAKTVRSTGASLAAGITVEASINAFVDLQPYKNKSAVGVLCQEILTHVRSAV